MVSILSNQSKIFNFLESTTSFKGSTLQVCSFICSGVEVKSKTPISKEHLMKQTTHNQKTHVLIQHYPKPYLLAGETLLGLVTPGDFNTVLLLFSDTDELDATADSLFSRQQSSNFTSSIYPSTSSHLQIHQLPESKIHQSNNLKTNYHYNNN